MVPCDWHEGNPPTRKGLRNLAAPVQLSAEGRNCPPGPHMIGVCSQGVICLCDTYVLSLSHTHTVVRLVCALSYFSASSWKDTHFCFTLTPKEHLLILGFGQKNQEQPSPAIFIHFRNLILASVSSALLPFLPGVHSSSLPPTPLGSNPQAHWAQPHHFHWASCPLHQPCGPGHPFPPPHRL